MVASWSVFVTILAHAYVRENRFLQTVMMATTRAAMPRTGLWEVAVGGRHRASHPRYVRASAAKQRPSIAGGASCRWVLLGPLREFPDLVRGGLLGTAKATEPCRPCPLDHQRQTGHDWRRQPDRDDSGPARQRHRAGAARNPRAGKMRPSGRSRGSNRSCQRAAAPTAWAARPTAHDFPRGATTLEASRSEYRALQQAAREAGLRYTEALERFRSLRSLIRQAA